MERRQGFFSALRELSPARFRLKSTTMPRRRKCTDPPPVVRSGCEALAPLMEGPDPGDWVGGECKKDGWSEWVWARFARAPAVIGGNRHSDLRLLLGVMGAPLAPVHVCAGEPLPHLSIKDTPIISFDGEWEAKKGINFGRVYWSFLSELFIRVFGLMDAFFDELFGETSSAQYILQQYTAASGGIKLLSTIHNSYAMGKMRMVASEIETATKVMKNRNSSRDSESGSFVLWQMVPEMWYLELAVGGSKIHAGCNGKIVWRHTPWLGAHAAKGPVRPLRRALQGLDPLTTANMFANAQCIGEKKVDGEDCFILKLCADPHTLKARSEGAAEIIRHVMFGYFSQKTGLLVHMEDSHLTRIQPSSGGESVYWETTTASFLDDYHPVDGVMVAHSGRSIFTLFKFGEVALSHTKTRMEEVWTIDEVAFNVPGLSVDCFIPPSDLKGGTVSESCELDRSQSGKMAVSSFNRAKVVAF